jgi:spore coat polysaccharide biosynthesis protein SpsF (cytidylyltransferase family)
VEFRLRVVAIIQARMGSSRFPGKVLAEIDGKPILEILISRIKLSKFVEQIVVATTVEKKDDILCDWLSSKGIEYFRGSERDVLDRFWKCAKLYRADVIVRITADDPLKDSKIIDEALGLLKEFEYIDYVSNTIKPTYPEGLDLEVFRFSALDKANMEASLDSEREHVTPYIWKNMTKFKSLNFEMIPNLSNWRWTVDKPEDLEFVRSLFSLVENDISIGYQDLIEIVNKNPSLRNINSKIVRNEGYNKSRLKEIINE